MLIFLHVRTRARAPMNTHAKGQVERDDNKAAMIDTSTEIRLTLQRRRGGGETMDTKEEEREAVMNRKRQTDRYNAQKQDDVDLLDAKLFFAFVPAQHNLIEFKIERKQRLRHKERQRCGEQRMQKIMKTCPPLAHITFILQR